MNLVESFRIAMRSLGANKMRAGLTMLGVIIGVAAVIALVSIGRGMQDAITNQVESLGTNLLFVTPGATQQGGVRTANGNAGTLTLEDGQALVGIDGVVGVAPEGDSFGQAVFSGNNTNSRVIGVTPEYQDVRNFHPTEGEFISATNVTARSLVACLGTGAVSQLFDGQDPIGQSIRINNVPFRVQCVMESKGGTSFLSQDNQIFVPLTTAQTRLSRGNRFRGGNNIDSISVELTNASLGPTVTDQIGQVLRERHHATFQDDFTVTSQQDALNSLS